MEAKMLLLMCCYLIVAVCSTRIIVNEDDLNDLRLDMLSLKEEMQLLGSENALLKTEVDRLNAMTATMMDTIQTQREEINALHEERCHSDTAFNDLRVLDRDTNETIADKPKPRLDNTDKAEVTDDDVDDVASNTNDGIVTSNKPSGRRNDREECAMKKKRGAIEQGVAFSATVAAAHLVNLGQGQTIIFDHVISNLGNAYDNRVGIFRVPVNGWLELESLRQEMMSMKEEMMRLQHDNRLLTTVHDLQTKTNALVETVQRQDEEIIALRIDNKRLKANIAKLEEDDVKKAILLQRIQDKLSVELDDNEGEAVTDAGPIRQPIGPDNPEIPSAKQNMVSQRITKTRRFIAEPNETFQVAFSALVTPSNINNIQHGQRIVFDKVISNLGNAYDHSNGVFRVPVSGWYVFSLTIMSVPGQQQSLQVAANGGSVFHCYSEGVKFNSGSRTIVWYAAKGDDIWVEPGPWPGSSVHGDGHTSFTAFLLYAD